MRKFSVADRRSTKIVFEQHEIAPKQYRYKVVSLTNRTRPVIGEELKEDEVQALKRDSENLTIEIKPAKKQRR